jgi:DNA repair protein RadC
MYRINAYRLTMVREATFPTPWGTRITDAQHVAQILAPILDGAAEERFFVLALNGKSVCTSLACVSVGSLTAALVHPREVFRFLIAASAASCIVAHNHPSGDPTPSAEDCAITERLRQVGELCGIRLLDSVVIGEAGRFVSMAEAGKW